MGKLRAEGGKVRRKMGGKRVNGRKVRLGEVKRRGRLRVEGGQRRRDGGKEQGEEGPTEYTFSCFVGIGIARAAAAAASSSSAFRLASAAAASFAAASAASASALRAASTSGETYSLSCRVIGSCLYLRGGAARAAIISNTETSTTKCCRWFALHQS